MLLAGHTVERISHDYGIDLILFTYNTKGEPEPGQVLIQVKATEQTRRVNNGREIVFRVERADVLTWVSQADPVLLIVYDARADQAWWLHVQGYAAANRRWNRQQLAETISVRLPLGQVVNPEAARVFAGIRAGATASTFRLVHEDD